MQTDKGNLKAKGGKNTGWGGALKTALRAVAKPLFSHHTPLHSAQRLNIVNDFIIPLPPTIAMNTPNEL